VTPPGFGTYVSPLGINQVLRQQVQLHGVMARKVNQNSVNSALYDDVSGQLQPATALCTVPIDRRLVGSQSLSGRRDGEYAV